MRKPHFALAPLTLAAFLALGLAATAQAQTGSPPAIAIAIEAQPLGAALNELARQANLPLLFPPALVAGKTAPAVSGTFTPSQALDRLLQGSGLIAIREGEAIVIREAAAADSATLAAVTVTAEAEHEGPTESSGSLASSHAQVGGKTTQSLREIPKAITVLTSQEIEDKHIVDLREALEQVSGITASPDTRTGQIYARGFTVSNLQIDGGSSQAMSQGYGAGIDGLFGLPNMAAYDHVEVLRGADGLFSGNGEPGATINLARKRPTRERQLLFSTSIGSWNDHRAMLDGSGPLNEAGTLRGRAVAAWQDSDSWYDTVWLNDRFFYGIVEADLTKDTLLTLGASYDNQDGSGYERSQTWRAGSLNGQLIGSPRNTWNLPWSNYHQVTRQVFGKLEQRLGDDWKLAGSFTWQDQNGEDLYARQTWLDSDTRTGDLIAWYDKSYNRQIMADLNLTGGFDLLGRHHDVVLGADSRQSRGFWRSTYPDDTTASIDNPASRPSAAEIAGWSGDDFDEPVSDANKRIGYYGTLRLHLADPLKLTLGGRYSQNTTSDGEKSIGKFIPFAGLTYDLQKNWTAFASVSDIYQPLYKKVPVGQYNPDPSQITFKSDPTTGRNYELGVKGELGGALQVSASLFYITKRNVWVNDTEQGEVNIPGYGKTYMKRPAGDVTSRGIDLEAKGEIARGWQVSAGYTYNITHDDGDGGKPLLEFAPKHTASVWTTYRLPGAWSDWRVGGGIRAISSSSFQGGYSLLNASVGYRINKNFDLDFIVKNLTDKLYRAGDWDGPVWGVGRSAMLTLHGKF